jgi:hypothetical protein
MEDLKHLHLLEEYISKGKSIEKFVDDRLNLIYDCLKIYDDVTTKSEVIQKIGYEIDEVLSKIDTLERDRKSKFI